MPWARTLPWTWRILVDMMDAALQIVILLQDINTKFILKVLLQTLAAACGAVAQSLQYMAPCDQLTSDHHVEANLQYFGIPAPLYKQDTFLDVFEQLFPVFHASQLLDS